MVLKRVADMLPHDVEEAVRLISREYRDKGDDLELRQCPYCGADDWRFLVSKTKKVFFCRHDNNCGAKGTLFKLLFDRGIINPTTKAVHHEYAKVPKEKVDCPPDFVAWYERERGIKAETLQAFKVGCKTENGKRVIVYRYMDSSGEFNRKYRSVLDKKEMWTVKGALQGYYGGHLLEKGERLIVVSGEDDAHALYQMGLRNVVSVPFGDKAYTPAMDLVNGRYKELVLCMDADEPGQEGAYAFAQKAGIAKCRNVVLPFKDARDCLLEGVDVFGIEGLIREAKPFVCKDVIKPSAIKDAAVASVFSSSYVGVMLPCARLNRLLGGVRLGELSTVTAHTGSGKTTFCLNLVWWALIAGMRALVMSFENTMESVVLKLVEISTRETIRKWSDTEHRYIIEKDRKWLEEEIERLSLRELYFMDKEVVTQDGYLSVDRLKSVIEYAVKFNGVNLVLVDHLHYFLNLSQERNPVYKIDETMRQLSQLVQRLRIHMLLVVHPHKIEDKEGKLIPVGLNSAKGASSIQQEAYNFFTVQRSSEVDKLSSKVKLLKNRSFGKIGEIEFAVLPNMNSYEMDEVVPAKQEEAAEPWWDK